MSGNAPVETTPASQAESQVVAWLADVVDALGGQHRSGQQEMATEVAKSLENGTHLLVQAGTGTGKSLAYLIPAVDYALTSESTVIIDNSTLALSHQIIKREIYHSM